MHVTTKGGHIWTSIMKVCFILKRPILLTTANASNVWNCYTSNTTFTTKSSHFTVCTKKQPMKELKILFWMFFLLLFSFTSCCCFYEVKENNAVGEVNRRLHAGSITVFLCPRTCCTGMLSFGFLKLIAFVV